MRCWIIALPKTAMHITLEANANPQIVKDEDFARSAAHVGISYPKLLDQLPRLGMRSAPMRVVA